METIWRGNTRFWYIIFNFNFPVLLWFGATWLHTHGVVFFTHCFIKSALGFCFGCGLTHDLVALVSNGTSQGILLYLILAGFMLNFLHSIKLACASLKRC
jgi:hypothetical protein